MSFLDGDQQQNEEPDVSQVDLVIPRGLVQPAQEWIRRLASAGLEVTETTLTAWQHAFKYPPRPVRSRSLASSSHKTARIFLAGPSSCA